MALMKHFHGIVPRVPSLNLNYNYADIAENVDLRHTTLRAWRSPLKVKDSTAKTIFQVKCCWYEWDKCVEVAPWTVDCPRLYVTGDKAYPYVMPLAADCTPQPVLRLGVPAPKGSLSAKAVKATQPASDTPFANAEVREDRAYLYTYVNSLDEEGPPSYPSESVDTDDGSPVTLTGFEEPAAEYGVVSIRIYRLVTGYRGEVQLQQGPVPMLTDYFHVATIPVGQKTYVDSALNVDILGDVLETIDVLEPPKGLRGIVQVPNSRLMAGFVGNMLCVSINNQPYNWPIAHRYQLDDTIRAISVSKGRLYVLTDAHPYTVVLNGGMSYKTPHTVMRHDTALPMVACNARGAISTPIGVFYVSDRGLVAMGGNEPTVVSSNWFSPENWRALKPETMRLGWHDGALFITSDTGTYVLQLDDNAWGSSEYNRLTTLTLTPEVYFTNDQGELFMRLDNTISQWAAGDSYLTYRWRSSTQNSKGGGYFGAVRLWADGAIKMSLYAEDIRILEDIELVPLFKQRLPHYGHHLHHQVEFVGTHEVQAVELASTYRDLSMY